MNNKQMEITKQYVKRYRQREFWRKIVSVLGCFVVFCTTYALILPAITMDQGTICGMIEHQHTSDCYIMPESGHVHTDACYTETVTYICGMEETEDDDGFFETLFGDESSTSSAVEYEPAEPTHTHSDACMEISSELTCGLEEAVPHSHEDTCFDENGELICELPTELEEPLLICDITPHIHSDGCFPSDEDNAVEEEKTEPTEPELVCGKEAHQHEENCYDADGKLVCTIEEHTHADDCYTEAVIEETDEPKTTEPACGKKEHQHMETCYDADSNLICELEEHKHDASCYPEELVYQNITALVYTDAACTELLDNSQSDATVKIEISGRLPAAVFAKAYPVLVEQPDKEVLCAYDITLYREDDTVYEPTGEENITVSIQTTELENSLQDTEQPVEVYYVPEEGEPEPVASTVTEEGIQFDTTHFSVYMVTRSAAATNVFTYTSEDGTMTATLTLTGDNPAYNSADYTLHLEPKAIDSYNTAAAKKKQTVAEAFGYTMYFTDKSGNRQWNPGECELELSWPNGIFQMVSEIDRNDICYLQNGVDIAQLQIQRVSKNADGNITGITIKNPPAVSNQPVSEIFVSRYSDLVDVVFEYNDVKDAFITDPEYAEYYNSNSPIGTAGSFHIVAFGTAHLKTHTNGNVLANTLQADANFGTNSKEKNIIELSYVQNYTLVHNQSSAPENDGDIFVIGSNDKVSPGQNAGRIAINNTDMIRPWHFIKDKDSTTAPFIDLNRVKTEIGQLSTKLSGMTDANIQQSGKEITLTNSSGVGILNLTAAELAALGTGNGTTLQMKGFESGKNGTIVVNVDCSGVSSINMPNAPIYVDKQEQSTNEVVEFSAGKVIWNFVNAKGVVIDTNRMTGMVVAPGATVNIKANLNGTVVAENVNVEAESHRTDFTGTVVEPDSKKKPHQITIQKHDKFNVAKTLQGAEFKLYKYDSSANTEDKWVQIDDDAKQSTKILVTHDNGVIQLGGLKAGVAYKLEEIKAPDGYIKSDTPIYFWIKAPSEDTELSGPENFDGIMISPGSTLLVPNTKVDTGDYELPETGGSGTHMYILAGMMLILASTVLLYNQNRHRRGNV